jgi:mycothiol synthase
LSADVIDKERKLAAEGITIRHYRREDLVDYIQFQRDLMPGPWVEDARRNLVEMTHGRYPCDAIWLAIDKGKIIGFCQNERDHFGPFGVSDDYQGKGIGSVLLARTLYQMRINGLHCAWVLWTGERALKGVYGRLGFTFTRRFAIMKKELP